MLTGYIIQTFLPILLSINVYTLITLVLKESKLSLIMLVLKGK